MATAARRLSDYSRTVPVPEIGRRRWAVPGFESGRPFVHRRRKSLEHAIRHGLRQSPACVDLAIDRPNRRTGSWAVKASELIGRTGLTTVRSIARKIQATHRTLLTT